MKKLVAIVMVLLALGLVAAGLLSLRKTGMIAADSEGARLIIRGSLGLGATVGPTTEPQPIRAGQYTPVQLYRTLEQQIVSGGGSKTTEEWQVYSNGPWGELAPVVVEKGQTTVVKLDGPLIAKVDVTAAGSGVRLLAPLLVGAHGEHYSMFKRNGKTVGAPKFTILDKAGNVLQTGKFEYG
ncbi:MAG: hypothetical protein IH624_10460 [Phycisphaerae bacterium]|nr:hypothetical protein [Phycisphaerae bacterium]